MTSLLNPVLASLDEFGYNIPPNKTLAAYGVNIPDYANPIEKSFRILLIGESQILMWMNISQHLLRIRYPYR